MRLLVISPVFPPLHAGEAEYAYHLCTRLSTRGIDVHVLTSTERDGVPWVRPAGVTLHSVIPRWGWADAARIGGFVRKLRPDAVLLLYLGWTFNEHPMATYLPALVKRRDPGLPFYTLFFNRIGAAMHRNALVTRLVRRGFSRWAGKRDCCYEFGTLLPSSDRVFVLAEKHGAFLAAAYPQVWEKTTILPSLPCLYFHPAGRTDGRAKGRAALNLADDAFVIAFFGLVYPGKGIETLLRAFARVRARDARARLVVIGGTPDDPAPVKNEYLGELRALAAGLAIESAVSWTGGYRYDSLAASQYLYAADVAALPFEVGVALNKITVAAAASHGLPLVSTEPARLESAFVPGTNCLLSRAGDDEALASSLGRIQGDPDLRRRLSAGALRLADERFSWEKAVDALLEGLPGNRPLKQM